MNINKKILLIVTGSVILILFILAAVLLFRGIRQFGIAEKDLASARTQLNGFYKKDPFPTPGNIDIVRENAKLMKEWIRDIIDVAKRKQIDPAETRSPSVFINTLAKVRNGLQSKARQEGVLVNEDFGFGFDRYVAGHPATADHVPRLMQQLLIINEVSNIIIEEKAKEIMEVYREPFEGVRNVVSSGRSGRSRVVRRTSRSATSSSAALRRASEIPPAAPDPDAGQFEDDAVDAKVKLAFDFKARELNVINILNRLALNEMFIVVTVVDVEVETSEEATSEKRDARSAASRDRALAASLPFGLPGSAEDTGSGEEQDNAAAEFKRTPSREERVIYGGKMEKPARVHMELEIYRFK